MSRRIPISLVAVLVALLVFPAVLLRAVSVRLEPRPVGLPVVSGAETGLAAVRVDSAAARIEVVLGPVRLPAHNHGYRPPIQLVTVPVGGALNGYSWDLTDAAGRQLPRDMLHHVNLIDPDEPELFSNTVRHVFAAGHETEARSFTPLVGYPFAPGTRLLVISMFSNPTSRAIDSAYLRVRLDWLRPDRVVQPLPVFPFVMDVTGPVGEKSFPVPPGRTERSWEGSPLLDARVLAVGGHAHDFARSLRLEDLTEKTVLWEVQPVTRDGRLVSIPAGMPWRRGGFELRRDHRYRVSVVYENPTGTPAPHGGMGVIAGIAYVREPWPSVRYDDPDYRTDLANIMSGPRLQAGDHGGHMH